MQALVGSTHGSDAVTRQPAPEHRPTPFAAALARARACASVLQPRTDVRPRRHTVQRGVLCQVVPILWYAQISTAVDGMLGTLPPSRPGAGSRCPSVWRRRSVSAGEAPAGRAPGSGAASGSRTGQGWWSRWGRSRSSGHLHGSARVDRPAVGSSSHHREPLALSRNGGLPHQSAWHGRPSGGCSPRATVRRRTTRRR